MYFRVSGSTNKITMLDYRRKIMLLMPMMMMMMMMMMMLTCADCNTNDNFAVTIARDDGSDVM